MSPSASATVATNARAKRADQCPISALGKGIPPHIIIAYNWAKLTFVCWTLMAGVSNECQNVVERKINKL